MELADSFAVDRLVTSHVAALLTMLSAESFPVGPSVPSPLAAPDRCLLMCLLFLVPFLLLIEIQPPCFVNMRLPLRLHPRRRRSLLHLKSAYYCIQPLFRLRFIPAETGIMPSKFLMLE